MSHTTASSAPGPRFSAREAFAQVAEQRSQGTRRSSSMSENAMWKDDVDALQDINKDEVAKSEGAADSGDAGAAGEGKEAADARKAGQHQKVIVDAWGRPLNHWPTSQDYPSGSGDYDSTVPTAPAGDKKARRPHPAESAGAEGVEGEGAVGVGEKAADAHGKGVSRQKKVITDAWGRPLNHWPTSKDYPHGSGDYDSSVPQPPPGEKNARTPRHGESEAGARGWEDARGEIERESAARAAELQAAADAAGALALAAKEKVGGALLAKLEKTAADAEAAIHNDKQLWRFKPIKMDQAPQKLWKKLPWRQETIDFHKTAGAPRREQIEEEADTAPLFYANGTAFMGKDVEAAERQTSFTGWGLPRDKNGRATEIGTGGGFHGKGHFPLVDSHTLPMGGAEGERRPWKASVDDAAPPSPRIWSWTGLVDTHVRRKVSNAYPAEGEEPDSEASWREQDPSANGYTWGLGRGLGGHDEDQDSAVQPSIGGGDPEELDSSGSTDISEEMSA
jgi:hypothetical protein